MYLTLQQCPFSPTNMVEREEKAAREKQEQKILSEKFIKELENFSTLPLIFPITKLRPLSQKFSGEYANLPYGKIGTIGSSGCGPLAILFGLQVAGFTNVDFTQIVEECVLKMYRGYIFDETGSIVDGDGSENELFDIAERVNIGGILQALNRGILVTLLVSNSVYNNDPERTGNHFVSLNGIDEFGLAQILDGNLIKNPERPEDSETERDLRSLILEGGVKGAWAWTPEKVAKSLK